MFRCWAPPIAVAVGVGARLGHKCHVDIPRHAQLRTNEILLRLVHLYCPEVHVAVFGGRIGHEAGALGVAVRRAVFKRGKAGGEFNYFWNC